MKMCDGGVTHSKQHIKNQRPASLLLMRLKAQITKLNYSIELRV